MSLIKDYDIINKKELENNKEIFDNNLKDFLNADSEFKLILCLNKIKKEIINKGIYFPISKNKISNIGIEKSHNLKKKNKFNEIWTKKVKENYGNIFKSLKKIELIKKKLELIKKNNKDSYLLQQLGSVIDSEKIKVNPNGIFNGIKIKEISSGGDHILLLDSNNKVLSLGKNSFGQLGHGHNEEIKEPSYIDSLPLCKKISCGYAFNSVVTIDGDIYSWGAGENGRLGNGDKEDVNEPIKLNIDFKAKEIECGSVHTCCLSDNNKIYSWGHGIYNGHEIEIHTPKIIDCLKEISFIQISIGPGGYHTLCLTSFGYVYAWGHNRVGQLGFKNELFDESVDSDDDIDEIYYHYKKPLLVKSLTDIPIIRVSSGWGHSAVLTSDHRVLICGRNSKGQLGQDPKYNNKNEQGQLYNHKFEYQEKLSNIKSINMGGEHSSALTFDNKLYLWGENSYLQLGICNNYNSEKFIFKPSIYSDKNTNYTIEDVYLSSNVTFLLVKLL